jgi:hypothetical protein
LDTRSGNSKARLLERSTNVLGNQRQLLEESKHEAIRALSEGFAEKMARLQRQLTEKDVTVSNNRALLRRGGRRPHRKVASAIRRPSCLNFDWFMERLESFLSVEQRVRWCGVGVVDINSFKWYNDTLGHAIGDKDHRAGGADPVRQDPLGGLPRARARRRPTAISRAVRRR